MTPGHAILNMQQGLNQQSQGAASNALGTLGSLGPAQSGLLGQLGQQAAASNQFMPGKITWRRIGGPVEAEPVAEAAPIMRYDVGIDELVPVTQEWVDEIGRVVRDKYLELKAARDEIQRLTILQSFQPESVVEKSEQDRLWHALRMAAGG